MVCLSGGPEDFGVATADSSDHWLNRPTSRWFAGNTAPRLWLVQQSTDQPPPADAGPDISDPGPDLGDFPNSAFTLPKGRFNVEMCPATFRTSNAANAAAYAWPYMLRYGVTQDVEFRVSGSGLTSVFGAEGTTGFGVLVFDTKVHMWDDRMDDFIPAASLEVSLQTNLGSAAFRKGNEPGLYLNLDFPFTERTNLETSFGYSGTLSTLNIILAGSPAPVETTEVNTYIFSLAWALEQELSDKLSLFVHGYYARPVGVRGSSGIVIGSGFFYQLSRRIMMFGSANAGLDDAAPPFLGQLGLAIAY